MIWFLVCGKNIGVFFLFVVSLRCNCCLSCLVFVGSLCGVLYFAVSVFCIVPFLV